VIALVQHGCAMHLPAEPSKVFNAELSAALSARSSPGHALCIAGNAYYFFANKGNVRFIGVI
jgi:hypothetical protein